MIQYPFWERELKETSTLKHQHQLSPCGFSVWLLFEIFTVQLPWSLIGERFFHDRKHQRWISGFGERQEASPRLTTSYRCPTVPQPCNFHSVALTIAVALSAHMYDPQLNATSSCIFFLDCWKAFWEMKGIINWHKRGWGRFRQMWFSIKVNHNASLPSNACDASVTTDQ